MPHVVVVGGGLSGLATAFRLVTGTPPVSVTVLEPRDRPGGNIGTETDRGFRYETGPNGFFDNKPFVMRLCRDLGVADRLIAASPAARKNRFVFHGGRLHKLPGSPLGILTTGLLSLRGKLALLREPFRGRPADVPDDESVATFGRRRFGREAADVFLDALVTGIHAGDPEQLSLKSAFPNLAKYEAEAGSVVRGAMRAAKERRREAAARGEPPPGPRQTWSFPGGLAELVEALAGRLGPAVKTGARVRTVEPAAGVAGWRAVGDRNQSWSADAVVLACPAHAQAEILAGLDRDLAAEVGAIPYNRVAVVAVGYRESDSPRKYEGFGYLAPQNTRRDVLGVQWCSSIFPDRAPHGFVLWRALCGGVHRGDVLDWDDDRLVRAVHAELQLAQGVTGDPVFAKVVRWPRAIPQYVVGHAARVARIDARAARHPGLFLTGNAYRGVALNDCAEQAELVAAAVSRYVRGGG